MNITPEKLDELIRIVHLAGVEIIKIYKKKVTKKYKSDNTPVTNADIKANDIICKGLKRHFPDISVVSEEQVKKGKATQRFWLVDPLDGTKEFLKGNGEFICQLKISFISQKIKNLIFQN
jgi:3'(2'), 5'-bisphosphate nucleotidase